jgi:hypothetical protein
MLTGSFTFSLRLSSVISIVAVAPAGMVAPFDPDTVLLTVALKRCPTLCVLVHTREFDDRLISDPAGILPRARSEPDEPFVTVFPLAVFVGAVGAGAVVRGGVRTVEPDDLLGVRVGVRDGALATGGEVLGSPVAGTS